MGLRIAALRKTADEWALVLASQGLHPEITRSGGGFVLDVPEAERVRAAAVLDTYERENSPAADEPPAAAPAKPAAGATIALLLLAFFAVTGPRDPAVAWFRAGSADAERILHGEAWRAATALTLHADLGHVVGNAVAGLFFIGAVCGTLGVGLGVALVLAAGCLGNLVNALFQRTDYASVGASTAIFGAVGILAVLQLARHRRRGLRGRGALAPIAAALGLLAMLGTGPRADLSGHFFGLAAGVAIGWCFRRGVGTAPGPLAQWLWGAAAAAGLLACWSAALR